MKTDVILHRNFHSSLVTIRSKDCYFDSYYLARAVDKCFENWLIIPSTQKLIDRLSHQFNMNEAELLDRVTNSDAESRNGLWIHPNLAIAFAKAVSEEFASWVKLQINWVYGDDVGSDTNENDLVSLLTSEVYYTKSDRAFIIRLRMIGNKMGIDLTDLKIAKYYSGLITAIYNDSMARFN